MTAATSTSSMGGWSCATASSASPGSCRCTPRTVGALRDYLRVRDRAATRAVETPALLISTAGQRLTRHYAEWQFAQLRQRAGLAPRPGARPPRLHDLRHTFAVRHDARQLPHRRRPARPAGSAVHLPRARQPGRELLVPVRRPGTARARRRPTRTSPHRGTLMTALAPTLQAFFTDRLIAQRHASPHTIRSYRDTMRLLLEFAHQQHRDPARTARSRRPRRRPDRLVPRPPRARARQHDRNPQRPPSRDPLALPLRQPPPPRTRRPDRPRPRDPTQTPRPHA